MNTGYTAQSVHRASSPLSPRAADAWAAVAPAAWIGGYHRLRVRVSRDAVGETHLGAHLHPRTLAAAGSGGNLRASFCGMGQAQRRQQNDRAH